MKPWKQIIALVAVTMIVLEPASAQCVSCQRGRRAVLSESSCGGSGHRLFSGRLFDGDGIFGRWRARRADRRAAREASCGRAAEPSCAAAVESTDDTSFVDPSQFEDSSSNQEVPEGEVQDVDYGAAPEFGSSQPAPGQTAWQPPVPIRVEYATPPSPFDEPAQRAQTAAVKSFHPFPLGLMAAPY